MTKRRSKLCACCDAVTLPLVQFYNQDTGYALCAPCADWIEGSQGPDYLAATYGERGIHIESGAALPGMRNA